MLRDTVLTVLSLLSLALAVALLLRGPRLERAGHRRRAWWKRRPTPRTK